MRPDVEPDYFRTETLPKKQGFGHGRACRPGNPGLACRHVFQKDVDARHKARHDDGEAVRSP